MEIKIKGIEFLGIVSCIITLYSIRLGLIAFLYNAIVSTIILIILRLMK